MLKRTPRINNKYIFLEDVFAENCLKLPDLLERQIEIQEVIIHLEKKDEDIRLKDWIVFKNNFSQLIVNIESIALLFNIFGTNMVILEFDFITHNIDVSIQLDSKEKNNLLENEIKNLFHLKDIIKNNNNEPYVNSSRIIELKKITSEKYDLIKLIKLCEEINSAYNLGHYYSVLALLRIIIDHIPPIFGKDNFKEVANSFNISSKKLMLNLEKEFRNIADDKVHEQIRRKITLPNETQVNFSQALDALLCKIVEELS